MKKILAIIVLSLCFIAQSQADDASEFQIEGISIGDSALKYYSAQQINLAKKFECYKSFKNCEMFQASMNAKGIYTGNILLAFKKNDPDFIIHGIEGIIPYRNNIIDCYLKQNEIETEIKTLLFNLTKKEIEKAHSGDKTGKSRNKSIYFDFPDNSQIVISCYDWSTEMKFYDNLRVGVKSSQFKNWLNKKAYK
ncbi:hypothetical protein OAB09_04515 [Pelagibacteraceae bacterium]|nr:hypothetical protein [Pelagibacteraceae bacterium]